MMRTLLTGLSLLDTSFASEVLLQFRATIEVVEPIGVPDLLVIVATHGAGTTMLSAALERHPCIISVGEPFSAVEQLYAPSGILNNETALFRNHSEPDPEGTFKKLAFAVDKAVGTKVHLDKNLHMMTGSFFAFFEAVRKAACASYDLSASCGGRCILAHKLFPDYVANDFGQVRSYLANPRTAVIHMMRSEADVAASNARRFGHYSEQKQTRDTQWHEYITSLGRNMTDGKSWLEVHAEDLFQSPEDYFRPLSILFRDLDLGDQALVAKVPEFIDNSFGIMGDVHHRSR